MNLQDTSESEAMPPGLLRHVSTGEDGELLLDCSTPGRVVEVRVLTSACHSPGRIDCIRLQLKKLALVRHPAIRTLCRPLSSDNPPAFGLWLADGLDPVTSQLSAQSKLSSEGRLQIAAQLSDALAAAHRVGLCHGSLAASTILVQWVDGLPEIHVDFTAVSSSPDVLLGELSIEGDLLNLQKLFAQHLVACLTLPAAEESTANLSAESRKLLRTWTITDEQPPTIDQWLSVLGGFLRHESSGDRTRFLGSQESQGGGGGSSSHAHTDFTTGAMDTGFPTQVGRFELLEKIGQGGMGAVFKAMDLADGTIVAIKLLRRNGKDFARAVRRFRKEARLLSDAQNEHITKLIEVGEDGEHHYLAMEFVHGIDLRRWLAIHKSLPELKALRLCADLARALVEAHAREVVHRDIKPENILLKLRDDAAESAANLAERPIEDFVLKLTDFGIARHVHQSESMEVTQAGALLGTPKYMSPEQCKSTGKIEPAADVYSVGITLYQLLTGTLPFESEDFMNLASMHCFDEPPAIQKRNALITDQAARIVERALAKSPSDRFGDASQLLSELQRVLHGDSADMLSHPKLPEHDSAKVWDKTVRWQLKSSPDILWPFVSNTERLNEALGLAAVDYRIEKDLQLGVRRFGSFTLAGVKVAWEEHPYEWIEGQRMGILREFDAGPFKWFLSAVTLEPSPGGGTLLTHRVTIEPRSLLGRVLTTIEADWKGFKNLDHVYRRMDRSLQGQLDMQLGGTDAFCKIKPLSNNQLVRLDERLDHIMDAGVSPETARQLRHALVHWAAQDLSQLRPLAMADQLGVKGADMLDACLQAAHCGLLQLRWDVLCPTCRVSSLTLDKLSEIQSHTNCEACDVDFKSNLGDAIELVFRAHPDIREVNDRHYCIGGPGHSPHVVAQVRVEAGECLDVQLDLSSGDYLLRGPRLPRTQTFQVQDSAAPSQMQWVFSEIGANTHTSKLRQGRQTLTLINDLSSLHVARVERMIPRENVVTATMAAAQPLFLKLFPHQRFASNNPIQTELMAFVATNINNIDLLYAELGDTVAYELTQRLHGLLSMQVVACGGAVVKTIGERMLAVFNAIEPAVEAALAIRVAIDEAELKHVAIGIGVHCGPTLVTTQNNQLDYFGSTVRSALALPELAGCDILFTEAIYADPSVRKRRWVASDFVESIALPSNPNQRVIRVQVSPAS